MNRLIAKVVIFSLAFAFVEAAVVIYLRHLLGTTSTVFNKNETLLLLPGVAFLEPETAIKIIANSSILNVERVREFATLVMLAIVAFLAAKKFRDRIAFFFLAFGVWDIFYYAFLRLTIGWPRALSDLDTFFLLPVPWVGPVIVPLTVSTLLVGGSLLYLSKRKQA